MMKSVATRWKRLSLFHPEHLFIIHGDVFLVAAVSIVALIGDGLRQSWWMQLQQRIIYVGQCTVRGLAIERLVLLWQWWYRGNISPQVGRFGTRGATEGQAGSGCCEGTVIGAGCTGPEVHSRESVWW